MEQNLPDEKALTEAVERVREMERRFDLLLGATPKSIGEDPALRSLLESLKEYYVNGQWLRDYTLDEQGLLPENLKRGVLSQDLLYNFLESLG